MRLPPSGRFRLGVPTLPARGFTTLAPDFFHGVTTGEPDEAMRLMMGLAMDQAAKDVAGAAAYLLSEDARNVTGTTLYVDSGYHAMGM